jgi:hypothetical protein
MKDFGVYIESIKSISDPKKLNDFPSGQLLQWMAGPGEAQGLRDISGREERENYRVLHICSWLNNDCIRFYLCTQGNYKKRDFGYGEYLVTLKTSGDYLWKTFKQVIEIRINFAPDGTLTAKME